MSESAPTPELVDRAAKAIRDCDPDFAAEDWDDPMLWPEHWKDELRTQARAALKVHSEWLEEQGLVVVPKSPTPRMSNAGYRAIRDEDHTPSKPGVGWQAMITAAQQEDQPG